MSLENISRYISEFEAIKNYPEVKKRKDELEAVVPQLRGTIEGLNKELGTLGTAVADLKKENGTLREGSKKATVLQARVNELESLLATTDGKTLAEVEQAFLKSKEEEIGRVAEGRAVAMKAAWMKDEMPELLTQEASKSLTSMIEGLQKRDSLNVGRDLWMTDLPNKVESIIVTEIRRRNNEEFERRVQAEVTRRAPIEVDRRMKTAVVPLATNMEETIRSNFAGFVAGSFSVTCDKCETVLQGELTSDGIADLMRRGETFIQCGNEGCKDFFGRHRFKVTLAELVASALANAGR